MSMGTYACFDDIVEESFVREIIGDEPNELDKLVIFLEKNGTDILDFADTMKYDEYPDCLSEEQGEECMKLWKALEEKFNKATGLELRLNYHIADDRGDDVDGYFWCVDNVYTYTAAGNKHKDKITRKTWTVWG